MQYKMYGWVDSHKVIEKCKALAFLSISSKSQNCICNYILIFLRIATNFNESDSSKDDKSIEFIVLGKQK